jgi:hypothetical protein
MNYLKPDSRKLLDQLSLDIVCSRTLTTIRELPEYIQRIPQELRDKTFCKEGLVFRYDREALKMYTTVV